MRERAMEDQDLSPAQRLLLQLWTPVSEGLPEEGQAVFALGPVRDSGRFDYGGWGKVEVMPAKFQMRDGKPHFSYLYARHYHWDVCEATHWMPMVVPTEEAAKGIRDEPSY